jgi:hypothetical protein
MKGTFRFINEYHRLPLTPSSNEIKPTSASGFLRGKLLTKQQIDNVRVFHSQRATGKLYKLCYTVIYHHLLMS